MPKSTPGPPTTPSPGDPMPHPPITLPPVLRQFLAPIPYGAISAMTNDGAVLVLKAPASDIESCRGAAPVRTRYELHATDHGPVVRLVLVVHDRPDAHLTFESFCNVLDARQLAEWEDLLSRPYLRVLFFDQDLTHRLSKRISQPVDLASRELLPRARRLLALIDPAALDFDQAKASVMADNPIV